MQQNWRNMCGVWLILMLFSSLARAGAENQAMESMADPEMQMAPAGDRDCGDWAYFDLQTNMCRALSRPGDNAWYAMIHGNGFLVGDVQTGVRQANKVSSPNMLMADVGRTLAGRHYFNVSLMLTAERWTLPNEGYPEFAQIGEQNEDGRPYIDAQHPHSSPLMGLTVSDTISFGDKKDFVRLFVAPRGASTDGPISFMHRPTGAVNPDVPLGHHIGQDVGLISSTVVGQVLKVGKNLFETSEFNGEEPSPGSVDMPTGQINSLAFRYTRELGEQVYGMGSIAYVKDSDLANSRDALRRYSASLYSVHECHGWLVNNALIYGSISHFNGVNLLTSYGDEILFEKDILKIFGRLEWVERTAQELAVTAPGDPLAPRVVTALTAGITRRIVQQKEWQLGLGGSLTQTWLPTVYQAAYSGNPWTARVFLQLSGMKML